MPYSQTPAQILGAGVNQFIQHAPQATDSIARLRGALAYCEQTGAVLRDELLGAKRPSAPWIERVPQEPIQSVTQDA